MTSYIAPDYTPTSAVQLFGNVPRFGHTDDLATLVTGENDYIDYALGTVFIAGFIMSGFVLWLLFLLLCKCCGKRCGILSGQRLKDERPHWFVRTIVMLAAAFGLAAGVMYLMKATSSLYDTFDSIREGAQNLSGLATNITNIAQDLIDAGVSTKPLRDDLVQLIDNGVCSSFDGGNGDPIDVDSKAEAAVSILTELSDFTSGQLTDIKNNFDTQFVSIESDVTKYIDQAQDYGRFSYYAYGIIIISSLLYIGAYVAWFAPQLCGFKMYFCLQTWIVLPILLITIILTAVFTAAIGTALVVNSDFCTSGEGNDPESLLKAVLDFTAVDGMARESIDHYIVTGCATEFSGTVELDKLVLNLGEGKAAVADLKEIIEADQSSFESACGGNPGSLDPVLTALGEMKNASDEFFLIGNDAKSLLACKELNGVYRGLSHGTICKYLPETLAWMFVTMSIILVAGIILFTFRAALKPDKLTDEQRAYFDDYDDEDFKQAPSTDTPLPVSNRNLMSTGGPEPVDDQRRVGRFDDETADYTEDPRNDVGYYDNQHDVEFSRVPTNEGGGVEVQTSSRNLAQK